MPTEGWRGAAGDGCKVGLLHATCASVYIWLQLMGAKLAPAQGPYRLVVRTSRCGRDNPGSTPGEDIHDTGDDLDFARHRLASMEELGTLQNLGRFFPP